MKSHFTGLLHWIKSHSAPLVELLILWAAAMWLGKSMLNFDTFAIPYGADYLPSLQSQHFWDSVKDCGSCALWNGSTMGGIPTFVDILGANLHPLTAILYLLLGPINGSKMLVICAIWCAGLGQWLMARELGVGRIPRMWASLIGVAGGHLAGRMDNGQVILILSIGMASLTLPIALRLARQPSWRTAVMLGILLALTAVAGQGYIQIALAFSAPLFLILLLDERLHFTPAVRYFLAALGLAFLLAAPLLVPFLHFYPLFTKPGEPTFNNGQTLEYIALNLVIRDLKFLGSEALQKQGLVSINTLYIGWVPVLLAVLSFAHLRGEKRRQLTFLWFFTFLMFWFASGDLLRLLSNVLSQAPFVRWPSVVASMAVVSLLGLAAYALDHLLHWDWAVHFSFNSGQTFHLRAAWLLLLPLAFNFLQVSEFSGNFYSTYRHDFGEIRRILTKIPALPLQWINPPDGIWSFYEMATQMKLKISPGFRPYEWRDRSFPDPQWIIRLSDQEVEGASLASKVGAYSIYMDSTGSEYAAIMNTEGEEIQPCAASGWGGDILVVCQSDQPGALVVKENQWNGWYAWRDGRLTPLLRGQWLSTDAPAGEHTYRFRYLPWDAAVGILLCLVGIGLSIWLWRKAA